MAQQVQKKSQEDRLKEKIMEAWSTPQRAENLVRIMGRFCNYSRNNQLLILEQRPDAKFLSGESVWNQYQRQVKEDVSPVIIYEPIKQERETADGEKKEEIVGYRKKEMYELSDTEGAAYNRRSAIEISDNGTVTDFELIRKSIEALVSERYKIQYDTRDIVQEDSSYDAAQKTITICNDMSQEKQLRALLRSVLQVLSPRQSKNRQLLGMEMLYEHFNIPSDQQLQWDKLHQWGIDNSTNLIKNLDTVNATVSLLADAVDTAVMTERAERERTEREKEQKKMPKKEPASVQTKTVAPADVKEQKSVTETSKESAAEESIAEETELDHGEDASLEGYDMETSMQYLKEATLLGETLQKLDRRIAPIQLETKFGLLRYGIIRYGLEYIRLQRIRNKMTNERFIDLLDYVGQSQNIVEMQQRVKEAKEHFTFNLRFMDHMVFGETSKQIQDKGKEAKQEKTDQKKQDQKEPAEKGNIR